MTSKELENILKSLEKTNARYFKLSKNKNKIEIIRNCNKIKSNSEISVQKNIESKSEEINFQKNSTLEDILSPYVGFFQRSEKTGNKPLVKLREIIKKGQIIAYIRSINLHYEIIAEIQGKIVEVLVEEGQVVEYGQPLFRLKKNIEESFSENKKNSYC